LSSIVGGVDLLNSVESSDVSKFISSGDHEVADTNPGGWGNVDSSVDESFVALEVESRDLDSEEGWDDNTFLEEGIEGSNVGVGNSLEFSLEGSGGHSGDFASEAGGNGVTNVGGSEGTEDGSSGGGSLSDGFDVVEFSIDGFFVVNGDSDSKVEISLVSGWHHGDNTFFSDEFSFDSNSFTFTVFGKDFWNNDSKVISGNSNVQFGEEIGDIKGVLGRESGFKKGVDGVLRKESLGGFSSDGSGWEGNWGVGGWGSNVLVVEFTSDGHLEDVVSGESGTFTVLSVVSGDSSKIWDGLFASVDDEVLVDGGVNDGNNLSLNLFDNKWDNGGFEHWDEDGSNLGNEGSGKGDIEIIGVDVNI